MASVNKDGKGWRIRFYDGNGKRQQIRLSGLTKVKATAIGVHVEELNSSKTSGLSIDRQTALWLSEIGKPMHEKLANAGLVESRELPADETSKSLADALQHHIRRGKTKTGSPASAGTVLKWKAAAGHLNDFFGVRDVDSITAEDAENFRDWLGRKTVKKTGKPFSENNIRSVIASAKMFFNAAKRRKWVTENAFENEVSGTQENWERSFHVKRQTADLILTACPDTQWRLMFALWRLAGLRKMEVFALRWEHVLWDKRQMVVPSSKTAHHTGCEERVVPVGEIMPYLEAAFDEAPEGTQRVVTRYDESNSNLDKPFRQILQNVGVVPWPKLFQNLRASCETDWLDWVGPNGERNSAHVVASWVGHSIKVQNKHYAQVDGHHFEQFNTGVAPPAAPKTPEVAGRDQTDGEVKTAEGSVFPARARFDSSRRGMKLTRPGLEPGITESKSVVLPITLSGYAESSANFRPMRNSRQGIILDDYCE